MTQLSLYDYNTSEQYEGYSNDNEYKRLIRSTVIFAALIVLAGIIYYMTNSKLVLVVIGGGLYVLLTLYSIPFGLMVLFALLSTENVLVLSEYFTISKVAGVVILLSFVVRMFNSRLTIPYSFRILFFFVGWAGLSILWSVLPISLTVVFWLSLLLNFGLIFIMTNVINDKRVLFLICSGFAIGAFISSLLVASGNVAKIKAGVEVLGRVQLHEQTNTVVLAFSLTLGIIALVHMTLLEGRWKKLFAVVALLLTFYALFRTQGRAAIACSVVIPVGAFILCSSRGNRLKYLVIAVLFLMISLVSLKVFYQSDILSTASKSRMVERDLQGSGRLYFWSKAIEYFLERPLTGWGMGNYPGVAAIKMDGTNLSAHNNIFAIMAELGIVGLILITVLFVKLFWATMKINDLKVRWLAVAMLMYAVLSGITVTNYFKKNFWYSTGVAIVAISLAKKKEQEYEETDAELYYTYCNQQDTH